MAAKHLISFHRTDSDHCSCDSCNIAQLIDQDPQNASDQRTKYRTHDPFCHAALLRLDFLLVLLQILTDLPCTIFTYQMMHSIDLII